MLSAVAYCHALLRNHLRPGDWVVDATAGQGHDTCFLTHLVGPGGRVYAFDVQPQAIAATASLLEIEGVPGTCYRLIPASHAEMKDHLPEDAGEQFAAVVFNLGYLPGGDKSITTCAESSLAAVQVALGLLRPGGLLLMVVYPGHPAGAEEAKALRDFISGFSPHHWHVTEYSTLNAMTVPPAVLAVRKAGIQTVSRPAP